MRVTLIGMGCGASELLPPAAEERIRHAELLIGSERLLSAVTAETAEKKAAVRTEEIMTAIRGFGGDRCAVLFSGDAGFYSGAASLTQRLRKEGVEPEILPGISSVQLFAARLGRPWQGWTLCSAHGSECDIVGELRKGAPVFLLTGGAADVQALCRRLTEAGLGGCLVTVGERLSYPDERITSASAREMMLREFRALNVMLAELPAELLPIQRTPGIPDAQFVRGNIPMTKQEVRAAIMAKLAVRPSDVCWDVGAGTGSVSVELALAGKDTWAVERQAEACGLIRRNREKFRAWSLHVVEGTAPEVLAGLPAPDAVFVGGSGGRLEAVLDAVWAANPGARLCVSAIALETLHAASSWMTAHGCRAEITQISVSRTEPVGGLHLLLANNPVFLIAGERA